MTKAPRAGRVKTRLTPPLSSEEAAALNVCFLRDTGAAISTAAGDGFARCVAVYTPVGEEAAYAEMLPVEFHLVAQRGQSFGDRLTFAAEDLFQIGFNGVCLIDSDSPTLPPSVYVEAVRLLAQSGDRMVLGPSDDGGYYLIGLKQLHCQVFEEIDWSTERVAEQTRARAREIGLKVEMLPTWYDVDDRATLQRLCDELLGNNPSVDGYPAPATRALLSELIRDGRLPRRPGT